MMGELARHEGDVRAACEAMAAAAERLGARAKVIRLDATELCSRITMGVDRVDDDLLSAMRRAVQSVGGGSSLWIAVDHFYGNAVVVCELPFRQRGVFASATRTKRTVCLLLILLAICSFLCAGWQTVRISAVRSTLQAAAIVGRSDLD